MYYNSVRFNTLDSKKCSEFTILSIEKPGMSLFSDVIAILSKSLKVS